MSRSVALGLLTAAALAFGAPAGATVFSGSYVVNVNNSDPGLIIETSYGAGAAGFATGFNVDVNGGSTTLNDLFRLWTDEDWVNPDDTVATPISVTFSFILPAAFGGEDSGSTVGVSAGLFGFYQYGEVHWNDPVTWETSFGTVTMDLADAVFNSGDWWGGPDTGSAAGASISGTISAVPEPLSISLLGFGLLATAYVTRRRRGLGR